jgi:hypothetical protein
MKAPGLGSLGKRIASALNRSVAVRSVKNGRNAIINRGFIVRDRIAGREFAARLAGSGSRHHCFSVSFNTPWLIDLLCASWKARSTGMSLAIVDNSRDTTARAEIARICRGHDIPYLPLPGNPEWSPNRSHALALNWTWQNVVRPLQPITFGWIDHDCFPVRDFDVPSAMGARKVYGLRRPSSVRPGFWNLWAGYSFFRFEAVRHVALNFIHRVEWGLDTGGSNWNPLYRHLTEAEIGEASVDQRMLRAEGCEHGPVLLRIDRSFLHVAGASYRLEHLGLPPEAVIPILRRHVLAGDDGVPV